MGAIITEGQMEKILANIESGKREGATLVCGGERYTEGNCANGYFVRLHGAVTKRVALEGNLASMA